MDQPEPLREAELIPEPRGNPAPPGPRGCPLFGRDGWGGRTARPASTPSPQPTHASRSWDAPPPGFGRRARSRVSPSTGLLPLPPLMDRLTQFTWVQPSLWLPPFLPSRVLKTRALVQGIINAGRTVTSSALKLLYKQLFRGKDFPLHSTVPRRLIRDRA